MSNMHLKKILVILISLFISTHSLAQVDMQKRLELLKKLDMLDSLDFADVIAKANGCTQKRDFSCTQAQLNKAEGLARTNSEKNALYQAKKNWEAEKAEIRAEERRREERRLAKQRRQRERERERARLRRLQEEREQEEYEEASSYASSNSHNQWLLDNLSGESTRRQMQGLREHNEFLRDYVKSNRSESRDSYDSEDRYSSSSYDDDYESSYRDSSDSSTSYSSNNNQSYDAGYASSSEQDICDLDPIYRNPETFYAEVSQTFNNEQKWVAERNTTSLVQKELDAKCPEDDWVILTSKIGSVQCEGEVTREGKAKLESGEDLIISQRGDYSCRGTDSTHCAVRCDSDGRRSSGPKTTIDR